MPSFCELKGFGPVLDIWEKIPCSSEWLMIKLSEADKTLTLYLKIVTVIFNGTKLFPLFNRDISLFTSCSLVGLSRREFNELFLTKFWIVYSNQESFLTQKDQYL